MDKAQEAELRAKMAQARGEMTIDLDEPEPDVTASPVTIDADERDHEQDLEDLGTLYPFLGGNRFLTEKYVDWKRAHQNPESFQKPQFDDTEIRHTFPRLTGLEHSGAQAIQPYLQPVVNAATNKTARDQEERLRAAQEQEDLYKRAIEKAKQIAAVKAQQEKVAKDRDEAAAEGRGGYRVERAMYPSDLYRK